MVDWYLIQLAMKCRLLEYLSHCRVQRVRQGVGGEVDVIWNCGQGQVKMAEVEVRWRECCVNVEEVEEEEY